MARIQLKDLDEDRLMEGLLPLLPKGRGVGPGDDAAAVPPPSAGELLLLTTDCVVEGRHFLADTPPGQVARKALCRNISDIAAMGGHPDAALVTLLAPPDSTLAYWKAFYRGLARTAAAFGISIAGGETTSSPVRAISICLTGHVSRKLVVTRSGGRAGDVLYVTGSLGGSLSGRHLTFSPRLAEGQWLARKGFAVAMMDLSDGLASDLPRLARASGCGFFIDPRKIPCNRGCSVEAALRDGEDYELLLAVPAENATLMESQWKRKFPALRLTRIGGLAAPGTTSGLHGAGFDHFSDCHGAANLTT